MPAATIKAANTVSISSCCRRTCHGTRRSRPRPKTHGPQTARVVGPAGESIWTDKYGRIKVKFHWDRFGPKDDGSSCWVRVSSARAGGATAACRSRVNDEVVVDFINGDPDRPIVTGRVYNEASMPPWALPAAATQMGFMSRSKMVHLIMPTLLGLRIKWAKSRFGFRQNAI